MSDEKHYISFHTKYPQILLAIIVVLVLAVLPTILKWFGVG